jgi:serine/threonine protein kinase/Tol biopolymer transport system component
MLYNSAKQMSVKSGTRLGPYEVLAPLGSGGMGDVYEAIDPRLERRVALKVLPREFSRDQERLRRFVQEAKTASSLNHPSIVTIFDIGEETVDGETVRFIAMELIDGVTLRTKFSERPPLRNLLLYLAKAAEGLARAHAAGVVHRDLKPDNIMVTRDGMVKVLDFGLARQSFAQDGGADDRSTVVRESTREGVVMGTVGYMAPEQVQGKTADARSDIFAFGCILYEAITGRKAFTGKSDIDVLHSVLNSEPASITEVNPSAPVELRRIVKRCLAKDPDERFQSIRDVSTHLRDLAEEYDALTPGSGSRAMVIERGPSRRLVWILSAIGLLLLVSLGVLLLRRSPEAQPPVTLTRVTTSGDVWSGSISPDGRLLALDLFDRDKHRLVIRQIATGSEVLISGPSDVTYGGTRFTADGSYLYVTRNPGTGRGSYLEKLPTLGGTATRILDDIDSSVSLSPDETRFVFLRRAQQTLDSNIVLADADGRNQRIIASRKSPLYATSPRWAPDGKWIVWPVFDPRGEGRWNLELVSPDGTKRKTLLREPFRQLNNAVWAADSSCLWINATQKDTNLQLWRVSMPDGAVRQVTNDTNHYAGINGPTADGRTLMLIQFDDRLRLWKVTPGTNQATAMTSEAERNVPRFISVTSSSDLVFESDVAGSIDVWVQPQSGGKPTRLTSEAGREYEPAVSRDGTIAYIQERGEEATIWTMGVNGSNRREVARLTAKQAGLDISPDGKWIAFGGSEGLMRVPASGGPVQRLHAAAAGDPSYSPDGERIATYLKIGAGRRPFKVAIVSANGGAIEQTIELPPTVGNLSPRWSPDGKSIVYDDLKGTVGNLWLQPLAGGPPKQLTFFENGVVESFAWSADGSTLLVTRRTMAADVLLATGLPTE